MKSTQWRCPVKALIVYDSVYGNTEKIAKAIAEAITPSNEVKVLRAAEANPSELAAANLLIVGSPTHAGRPVPAVQNFLNKVPELSLKGVNVAAFDTRIAKKIVGVFGYAAGRIAGKLKKKGGTLIASPEGFFVAGGQGPLKEGELDRAASWAKGILQSKK
jgi:flavodoxin I